MSLMARIAAGPSIDMPILQAKCMFNALVEKAPFDCVRCGNTLLHGVILLIAQQILRPFNVVHVRFEQISVALMQFLELGFRFILTLFHAVY